MEVYVIRHTPVAMDKDTCYGQSDVPVADTFLQDMELYENKLPTDFDAVYCSPLRRCRELASALNFQNVIEEKALMEIDFGDWEHKKWNDINQEELNSWMEDFVNVRPPKGENLLALFERVKRFLDHLRLQKHRKVLLICHAGVIRCIWAYLLEIPLGNIFKLPVGHGQVMNFRLTESAKTDSIRRMM